MKAVDLIAELQNIVVKHGPETTVSFSLGEDMSSSGESVIGPVKIDSVELTNPARIDLEFEIVDSERLKNQIQSNIGCYLNCKK